MALTRVTSSVISSNVITSELLQNNIIQERHIQPGAITAGALDSSANAIAVEIRANANLDIVQDNVVAAEANIVLNTSNIDSFASFANTNLDTKANVSVTFLSLSSNDFVTFTRLNSNIDVVQNNVAAIINGTTAFTGQVTMNDDLVVTGNLVISGDTTTANSVNMIVQDRIIMLANSATGTPADDIGFLFNRGNQGNAAIFYDESAKTFKISDTKDPSSNTTLSPVTAGNLDVGILTATTIKYNGADLNTSISDNVAALTTNINTLDANADAIESRRVTNVGVMDSNDFVTFTRLNANLNSTTDNINTVSDNVAAITGGATLLTPFTNVNTALGTSNVFFIGQDCANDSNVLVVTLDGVRQHPTADWIGNYSNDTVQFVDATIPSGTIVSITSLG
jgi:hypothetical protein